MTRVAVGVAAAALVATAMPAAALSATATTSATVTVNSVLTISAPASVAFSNISVGGTSPSAPTPVVITSNAAKGYQLSVERTAFGNAGGGSAADNVDIPLAVANPSGAGVAPTGTTAAVKDVPVLVGSGSVLGTGNAGRVTSSTGDTWNLGLVLGPVPFTQDGLRSSTVTFTAVTTP